MSGSEIDHGLDALLALDGQVLVVDPAGHHWVKFSVQRIPATPEKPHGLNYSLTLHDEKGKRLVGFDNAHPIRRSSGPAGRSRKARDHKHREQTIRPYDYRDAASLLADFWAEVEAVLRARGIRP